MVDRIAQTNSPAGVKLECFGGPLDGLVYCAMFAGASHIAFACHTANGYGKLIYRHARGPDGRERLVFENQE